MSTPFEIPGFVYTLEAGSDLSAAQYKFVKLAADGQVDVVTSAGAMHDGVLQNKPDAAGRASTVMSQGITKVILGGTVAIGDKVSIDTSGRAVTASDNIVGTCLVGGAVNEIGSIRVDAPARYSDIALPATDTVSESTPGAGVTVDGVLNKDAAVTATGGLTGPLTTSTVTVTPGASTAAAGTTTADAGVLPAATSGVYPTTAADDTKGVRVHANDKVTGRVLLIGNGVSNKILKVYPPSGGTINGAAGDAAFSGASGKGVIIVCLSSGGNTWLAW